MPRSAVGRIGFSENIRVGRDSKLVSKKKKPQKEHTGQHKDCFACKIQGIGFNKANLR